MGHIDTKTFKSGNSVAVRLPKAIGLAAGTAVRIERQGDRLVLTPVIDPDDGKRRLAAFIARMREIGPVGEIEKREPFDGPERQGL